MINQFKTDELSVHMKSHDKKRKKRIPILPLIGIVAGILILAFYPASDLYYSIRHAAQKTHMERAVSQMRKEDRSEYLRQARIYNEYLVTHEAPSDMWRYEEQLSGRDAAAPFATLVIPKISLTIPVYHGTSTEVLASGAGHLKGSSLPVGGKSTHAVLTAHSGMKGMRAFDDIRELKKGDRFYVDVLGRKIAYRVYKVETLWPEEVMDRIKIKKGKDLCTLITCTPYGINDHRLLVHGRRCRYTAKSESAKPSIREVVTNRRIWPFEAAIVVIVLLILSGIVRKKRRKK
jgi:sortase A